MIKDLRKESTMNKLKKIGGVIGGLLLAITQSHAAGTGAGTSITNQASVSYNSGAGTVVENSNSVSFRVDELMSATLISQFTADISVSSGQTDAMQKFQLTNTGNGSEAFVLSSSNLTGDQFDVTNFTLYQDDGSDTTSLDITSDSELTTNTTTTLAPGETITIWVVSEIPSTPLNDNDKAEIQLSAISNTFVTAGNSSPTLGDSINNAGDGGTFAVYGISGLLADNATYVISDIDVNIVKAIVATRDNIGGSKAVPGAEVDYSLTVTVTGTGSANNVIVTDKLPDNGAVPPVQYLVLKGGTNGTITVNSSDLSASAATDPSAKYDANTHTITVELGDITAGATATTIEFTAIVQ
jgi:uncharacterized repeat protein (TIGR01451 family)